MDPFTPIAATINSSLRIFEVTYQLRAVGEQTADLLETTRHVHTNLNEARRQRRVKESWLSNNDRDWMDGVIEDTEKALRAVARLIEPARIDKATKEGINFSNRLLWVFRDNPQVRDKLARLSVCHQSLTAVITSLYSKDVVSEPAPAHQKEVSPPSYDPQLEELFNWHKRRRPSKSSMSLQSVAAETSSSTESTPTSTVVASPTWSLAFQGDRSKQGPLIDDSESAYPILEEPHPPYTAPSDNADKRPRLLDAAPTGRTFTAGWTLIPNLFKGDGRRPVSVDTATSDMPGTRVTREDILRQRQAEEQAINSRLPYPMSPSDYESVSALDSETSTSALTTKTPPSSQSASLQPAVEVTSSAFSRADPRRDGTGGLQLLTERTEAVDERYRHPPFSFTSFTPLGLSDSDSQQEQLSCDSYQDPTSPAYEGLQLVADLETPSEEASNEGQGPPVGREDLAQGLTRSPQVSPGRGRRGGRSWLMFHASRNGLAHNTS